MEIVKRDGSIQPFETSKVRKWVDWAVSGLVDKIEAQHYILIETLKRLPPRVTTEEVHQTMIKVCLDKEDILYSRVAAELEKASIFKGLAHAGFFQPETASFADLLEFFEYKGIWGGDWLSSLDMEDLELLNEVYIELEALQLEYWTIKQWSDKYAKKIKDVAVETPAMGILALFVAVHGVTDLAFDCARDVLTGKVNLPTPVANGIRDGNWDTISCSVIEGGDTVQSINMANWLASEMTAKKAGIGITLDTRSKGDGVKAGSVKHLGKQPLFKAIEAGVKMFTQITRGGSATVTIKAIDPDIMSMALWKTQRIDIAQRVDKVDYSFAYNDAFVQAVLHNEDWYLFSKTDAPKVHENFHAKDYVKHVRVALANGAKHKKVKALDVLIEFCKSRWETGRLYCINVTRANEHTPFIDPIKQSNLCVAPETLILTDKGFFQIHELENEQVRVWNGSEYSETIVRKTGSNKQLLKVTTDSGFELECTPEHKFYVQNTYHGGPKEVRAKDLQAGDKLIKLDTPVIQGTKELNLAYENGFYSGDGCYVSSGNHHRLYFYGDKLRTVYPNIDLSSVTHVYEQPNQKRAYIHMQGLKDKYFVPLNNYSVQARLDWLAGYLDADGSVYRNGTNEQLVANSINKEFLQQVQLMLQTLGVQSKVTIVKGSAGVQLMPKNDGSGELGEYECQQQYRLIIPSAQTYSLLELGLEFNRLKVTKNKPQRDARRFVQVVSVTDEGRVDDTFCFTEPKKHLGVFNGLLTGQCMEIFLPTKPFVNIFDMVAENPKGEMAFCALSALNAEKLELGEYFEVAERALRTVDVMIERAPTLTPGLGNLLRSRRSVGIGITGLAGYLYKNGLDYDGSYESLVATEQLAATHYYALLQASQKMAEESGFHVEGIDVDWLPIDTAKFVTDESDWDLEYDWEALRGKPRKHSVLVAHMPTESSAVFSGATNGVYPSRDRVVYKAARTGKVQFISQYYDETKKRCWDVDMVPYYQCLQNHADQGISADYYTDYTKFPDMKIPDVEVVSWFIHQAMAGIKSSYYQNFKDTKTAAEADCSSCKL